MANGRNRISTARGCIWLSLGPYGWPQITCRKGLCPANKTEKMLQHSRPSANEAADAAALRDPLLGGQAHAHALQQIVNGSLAFQGLVSREGILVEVNDTALRASGLTRQEALGQPFAETNWWTHDQAVVDRLKAAFRRAAGGVRVRYDEQVRLGDGSLIWIDFLISPVFDEVGNLAGFAVSALDITKRYAQLVEKDIVNRELDHRVRNLLAVFSAVVELTPASSTDELRRALHERLVALGDAQSLLLGVEPAPASLHQVFESAVAHLLHDGDDRLRIDGPALEPRPEAARALSMIAHELATNALKYGVLGHRDARILISWRQEPGRDFVLTWRETGNCPQGQITRRGTGSKVIDTLVRKTLGGRFERRFDQEGMTCALSCPAEMVIGGQMAPAAAGVAPTRASGEGARGAGRVCVLVVEDEPMQAMVIAETLGRAGYDVLGPAASLAEAEALLASARPGMAVLDINLAGESTIGLATRLEGEGVPVLVLSGNGARAQVLGMPHRLALPKPIRPGRLLEAVAELLPDP